MMLPLRDITADSPRICLYLGGVVVFTRIVILTTDYFTLSRRALMLHGFTFLEPPVIFMHAWIMAMMVLTDIVTL